MTTSTESAPLHDTSGPCDCASGLPYMECCGRYIRGGEKAPTAEALMRSRYSAYAREEVDYLVDTQAPESRKPSLEREILRFSQAADFEGLTIERTEAGQPGDAKGMVEFTANYRVDGKRHIMRERSNFRFDDDAGWYYVNGSSAPTRSAKKVGRNDPCPCESGKKYKKCCGR